MNIRVCCVLLTLAALCGARAVEANEQPVYSGNIDVLPGEPSHIQLNPAVMLLPGESMTLTIDGTVDVNHENYEERRCKYFGLKCWYEWRSVPHLVPASGFTVEFELRTEQGVLVEAFTRAASDQPITLNYPGKNRSLTQPVRVYAVLQRPGMNRTPCTGRPRYCSAGALRIRSTATQVDDRLRRIEARLKTALTTLDPLLVQSDQFIDPILIDTAARRLSVQKVFAEQMAAQRSEIVRTNARNIVEIAKFALGLSSANPSQTNSLNSTILEAYIQMGDYRMVTQYGKEALVNAKSECKAKEDGTFESPGSPACTQYAEILRLNAIGWLERRARYASTEIRVALGMLETAIGALGYPLQKALGPDLTCSVNPEPCRTAAQLYIDGARMLSVLRTRPELSKAEEWLTAARVLFAALEPKAAE